MLGNHQAMLKSLRSVTVLSLSLFVTLSGLGLTAIAQDSGCYMVTASGKVMNLSGLCGSSSRQTSAPTLSKRSSRAGVFQVPIKRREHGIPVLDVTFNGNQTFEMMMDSGASVTTLSRRMATALGVVAEGKAIISTASAQAVETGVGRVRSIEVGGATVNNAMVLIAGPELDDGLLGENFLKHYDVMIKQNVVEFHVR